MVLIPVIDMANHDPESTHELRVEVEEGEGGDLGLGFP